MQTRLWHWFMEHLLNVKSGYRNYGSVISIFCAAYAGMSESNHCVRASSQSDQYLPSLFLTFVEMCKISVGPVPGRVARGADSFGLVRLTGTEAMEKFAHKPSGMCAG